jgi:hypothetical protein
MICAFRKDSENSQTMCIEGRADKADSGLHVEHSRFTKEKKMRFQTRTGRAFAGSVAITIFAFAVPCLKGDAVTQVTVDTSGYTSQNALVAFDFVDGGPPSNTFTISNFFTDGILGAQSTTGGVTGSLPGDITLTDTQVFNELSANVTLGQKLVFDFHSTNLAPTGSFPDEFTLFLLNPTTQMSIIPSSDPTGAESLLAIDLVGGSNTQASIYSPLVTLGPPSAVTPAPEPSPRAAPLAWVSSHNLYGCGWLGGRGIGPCRDSHRRWAGLQLHGIVFRFAAGSCFQHHGVDRIG